MNRNLIENIQWFIDRIASAPLPAIPGAGLDFFLSIEAIRCQAVNEICANFIKCSRDADQARQMVEPFRLDLLRLYPDCIYLLESDTWPSTPQARIH